MRDPIITTELVRTFVPCNHWSDPALLARTLGEGGLPLRRVLDLDTVTAWEKLWLAARPEVLGAERLERFVDSVAGKEPCCKDCKDTPERRRTLKGAMGAISSLIDRRLVELGGHPHLVPALTEATMIGAVEKLKQLLDE
ncbi:MAG TPA: hypothetical protein VK932_03570 [Kofleriaceae bacterium]|nr:hypothetical protein [Kofleriaceae bacterium]